MKKYQVIDRIIKEKLFAVIRTETAEQALAASRACIAGGIRLLEITFTVPGAEQVIRQLSEEYGEKILTGAGTVLDPETARIAISSGARFIVSPAFSPETARICNRCGISYTPGIMTVTEAVSALESGAEIIKVFPGSVMGQEMIRSLRTVLPQGMFMPTGGVNISNIGDWLKAGACALGSGGSLLRGYETGDYQKITESASEMVNAIKKYTEENSGEA